MITTEKTLSQVMEVLRQRGYKADFNLIEEDLCFSADGKEVHPEDLVIDKVYRFTGFNDPGDEAILYAMHNVRDQSKGVFVNGYGTYSDEKATAVIDKIMVNETDQEDWCS